MLPPVLQESRLFHPAFIHSNISTSFSIYANQTSYFSPFITNSSVSLSPMLYIFIFLYKAASQKWLEKLLPFLLLSIATTAATSGRNQLLNYSVWEDKMPILPPIYNDHLILQAPHKEQNLHAGPSYFHIVINNLSMRGVKDRRDHICCCTALH